MAAKSISVVAYYRMSTDRQEASIPDQRDSVEKMARAKGYTILREYRDEGISGDDTERRAGFRQMLEEARTVGDFDGVLCWDQSRFGRFDPLEAGYWIKPLRDAGVWLETVAEGRMDWTDFAGRIVYAVQQEGKHAYLRDVSRAVTRSMLAKARRGEWVGGMPPYGYRLNDAKRLESGDPAEIAIVRHLFREYLNLDVSLAGLAEQMNARGVPTRRPSRHFTDGRPGLWSAMTVRRILTCPAYVGDAVWNRRHSGAYHGVRSGEVAILTKPRGRTIENDRREWVVFENTHEPLVDRATFERVQQRLLARREGRSTPHKGTGLLRCGQCGWPMYGTMARSVGQRFKGAKCQKIPRYLCGRYVQHRLRGCKSNSVSERDVLDAVLRTLEETFLRPEFQAALVAEIRRQEEAEQAGHEPPAADLGRRIAALTKKIETGTERWLTAPAGMMAEAGAKLEQWRRERESLQEQRRAVVKPAASAEALDAVAAQIAAGVATLRKRIGKAKPAEVRAVLREMLDKVVIDFRHVPFGRRTKSIPTGGTMHLLDSLVQCRPVTIAGPAVPVAA